jgi:hypothetical protein
MDRVDKLAAYSIFILLIVTWLIVGYFGIAKLVSGSFWTQVEPLMAAAPEANGSGLFQ